MAPAPQLKREQSPVTTFGRAKRQLSRDLKYIAQPLLKLSFLSSTPTCPATQSVSSALSETWVNRGFILSNASGEHPSEHSAGALTCTPCRQRMAIKRERLRVKRAAKQ